MIGSNLLGNKTRLITVELSSIVLCFSRNTKLHQVGIPLTTSQLVINSLAYIPAYQEMLHGAHVTSPHAQQVKTSSINVMDSPPHLFI